MSSLGKKAYSPCRGVGSKRTEDLLVRVIQTFSLVVSSTSSKCQSCGQAVAGTVNNTVLGVGPVTKMMRAVGGIILPASRVFS
jgi:hypothetical protein